MYYVPRTGCGTGDRGMKDMMCILEKLKSLRPDRLVRRQSGEYDK